jgi:glycosyl transferase family 87
MSLTLRQLPLRCPALPRVYWRSPANIPRHWLTIAFTGCAAFAVAMAVVTSNQLHRLWAIFAACAYLLAAMVIVAWKSWRAMDAALVISFAGALIAPLSLMAADQLHQPEVQVINQSASMLVHHGTPYLGPAALAAAHSPNIFDPYLPLMTLFGLPRALMGFSAITDPRIWFGAGFVTAFAAALAAAGVSDVVRWTALLTASPVIAFSLTVGGTDVPVLACQCLGLALLWRRPQVALAGLALGAAAAMKATAWPALLVAAVLVAVRDGRRATVTLTMSALAVVAVIVGPVAALWPRALVQNTIAFPLGLASIKSAAVSPLPGRLLAETGPAGRLVAVALLGVAGLAIVVSLIVRPPRTVRSATWRLVIGLSLMFVLAPATRFGYFVYPVGLLAWLGISGMSGAGPGAPPSDADPARSANSDCQPAYQ